MSLLEDLLLGEPRKCFNAPLRRLGTLFPFRLLFAVDMVSAADSCAFSQQTLPVRHRAMASHPPSLSSFTPEPPASDPFNATGNNRGVRRQPHLL